jgi:hypothetical protein
MFAAVRVMGRATAADAAHVGSAEGIECGALKQAMELLPGLALCGGDIAAAFEYSQQPHGLPGDSAVADRIDDDHAVDAVVLPALW